jgi:hypothetical protein
MATYKHLRSSTANKRPTTSIADGQLAINSNAASAGLFFKDSTGATIIKVGPVHVGTTAPNATPGAGGSSGNSTGEVWLDTSLTPVGVKIWNGSAWVNGTPIGSTTVQGLLELATDVETQAGSDTARAVTPASLQSKVSDSTSTTSSTTIASSTAVKSAFDLANAALPKSGGTVTGNLEIGTTGSLTFEGSVADGFETTIAVTNPTADRTITLPDQTGNMLVSGNASIVNADVNASAAIAGTKIAPDFGSQTVQTTGIFSHALGSAGAPTITFTGDTNTGIYSPGADQLAISTGGSGRLFVDASGNVGVGSTPSVRLDVRQNQAAYSYFDFYNTTAGGGVVWRQIVRNLADTGTTSIDLVKYTSGGFAVANNDTGAANFTAFNVGASERLRITSAGLVGVGTSAPVATFDVGGSTATSNGGLSNVNFYAGFTPTGGGNTFGGVLAGAGVNGNTPFIAASRNGAGTGLPLTFFTDGTERLRISSAGNVGIGTTTPGNTLTVNGSARVQQASSFAGINIRNDNDSSVVTTTSFVDTSNNLGTIDSHIFFEHLTSGGSNFNIATTPTGDRTLDRRVTRVIVGFNGTTTLNSAVTTSPFVAQINGAEVTRIDSGGRLLVGTSTSVWGGGIESMRTTGLQYVGGRFSADNFPAEITVLKSRGASVGTNTIVQNNDVLGNINFLGADGTTYLTAVQISAQVDGTPGTNDLPSRLVFSTTADGASSPTERLRITSAGVLQVADAGNIAVGTTTGTKIGTATTQKLGFYNKTPVAQPSAVANATDAASVITQLNALLARMRDLGLIAT